MSEIGNDLCVNGRRVSDGMKCPVCDSVLTPQSMEYNINNPGYCIERGELSEVSDDIITISMEMICLKCSVRVDISDYHGTIEYMEKSSRVEVDQYAVNQGRDWKLGNQMSDLLSEPFCYQQELEYIIMSIANVKYGRVKNLGNYETERFEAEVILDPGQTAEDAVSECKAFVKRQLGLGPTDIELEAARDLLREAGEL